MMSTPNVAIPKRGYIEGYFGKLLSFEQRTKLAQKMQGFSQSYWLYAPKEDSRHRIEWWKPYDADWLHSFEVFAQNSAAVGCSVIAGMSPGLSIDFDNKDHLEALRKKYQSFLEHGASALAILMDDIEARGLPINASLANSQIKIIQSLCDQFTVPLWFCPSIYCKQQVPHHSDSIEYLEALALGIENLNVQIYWTGDRVISESLEAIDLAFAQGYFSEKLVVWDNFYANDYTPWQIRTQTLTNRSKTHSIGINPTGLYYVDMIIMECFLDWHSNSDRTIAAILTQEGVPQELAQLWQKYYYFSADPHKVMQLPHAATEKEITADLKFFSFAFQHWFGDMKLEFFPFFMLMKKRMQYLRT